MEHPWRLFFKGAGPARAEYCALRVDDLGLDKKIAEGRVQRILRRLCKNNFNIARELDYSACPCPLGDGTTAQLDVILR
jgi:hypothetical protein